jgi:ABC-type antimicrobial peptide transport system permease subunit
MSETQETMQYLLGSFTIVSQFVAGVGIMNIMLVSVAGT